MISCSDARGNAIKFGLTPCGLLEVFKNGDPTSKDCITDDGKKVILNTSITYKVWETHGCLGTMKIDRDMPSDDNSASEAGSAANRVAADPRRSDQEIERERIRIQFRRDGKFREHALRQWKVSGFV